MKDAVIFGAGELGHSAVSFLEEKWRILFVLDNDEKKWGSCLGKYMVKSPKILEHYDGAIIIAASAKYNVQITKQILEMARHEDNIYYFCRFMIDEVYKYELCPYDAEKLKGTGLPLCQYVLLHKDECKTNCTKVLVCCSFYSTYTKQLIENISKRYKDVEFSLLTAAEEYRERINAEQLKHIYCFHSKTELKTILVQLPIYDAIQMLWIEKDWAYFYRLIRGKTKKLNLNVGGSDFYRASDEEKDFKKKLIACADKISAEIQGTVREFKEYYEKEVGNKMELIPFGVEVLDDIKSCRKQDCSELKRKYGVPLNKIMVACAHNADRQNRHLELIETLNKLPDCIKEKILCVFPMTYPDNVTEYIHEVEDKLIESGLDYMILTEFMDFQQMAELALISDIMIRIQTTDQLSSMMLEAMYAGTVVIAGGWLPYQSLHDMGMYFLNVDQISDVPSVLSDVVINLKAHKEKCAGNSEIVWNHSSWDVLAPRWHKLWE